MTTEQVLDAAEDIGGWFCAEDVAVEMSHDGPEVFAAAVAPYLARLAQLGELEYLGNGVYALDDDDE